MRPKCSLTWSKVLPSSSRVSRSILRIASSSVVIASFRSAFCASRKLLRSRAVVSSSSAARLTAPSAAISRLRRSISPCRPDSLTLPSSIDCAERFEVDLRPAVSCSRYCAPPSCAACSSSCSSVMLLAQRLEARARCCRRCSSAARSLRASGRRTRCACAPSACSRSSFERQRGLQAGLRRGVGRGAPSSCGELRRRLRDWPRPAAAAVSIARCSSPRRAASARAANCASCAWRSSARSCSRASASCALGLDHAPRRARHGAPARRPSCMSSSSKRASPVTRRSLQLFELGVDLGQLAVELLAARARSARPAASGAAARPAAGGRGVCASAASRRARDQALRRIGVGRLGAHQRRLAPLRRSAPARAAAARRFSISCCARQQAGLLGIGRVEADARTALTAWPSRVMITSPCVQLAARGQRVVEARRRCRRLRASRRAAPVRPASPRRSRSARRGSVLVRVGRRPRAAAV